MNQKVLLYYHFGIISMFGVSLLTQCASVEEYMREPDQQTVARKINFSFLDVGDDGELAFKKYLKYL